ncbi:MAG: type IX secretion system membrane protein PorP/SprF [Bacteroidetes bacterium]|nr:type IX secretion system membrane protein PorP/SprF [Bacteroidota bacterium]
MKKIIVILIGIVSLHANAQQDAQSSMYFFNPLNYNPAYAGSRGSLNFTGVHRSQWVGWEGAPNTQFLSIHAPIAQKHIGIGASMSYDRIGSRSAYSAMANFAYHLQLNSKDLRLSFGASAGVNGNQYDFNGLIVTDPSDPAYLNANRSTASQFGAGIYLNGKKGYLGFSVPKLMQRSIDDNTGESIIQRHYYLATGYVFPLSSVVDLKPSLLAKYTANAPFTIDVNLSAHLYNILWIGGLYRYNESLGFNTSYQINDRLMLGYAYDYPINKLNWRNWGSHEVVLSIDIKAKNNAFISPRYF